MSERSAEAQAGGTAQPAWSQPGPWPGPATTSAPRRAVLGVCSWPGRSHGASARGGTPRASCSPLSPHVAGTGAGEFWLQDLLAAVSADLDLNIQTLEDVRPPRRPPRLHLSPAGARSARGLSRAPGALAAAGTMGARGSPSDLCRREARLGASPSMEKATPRAEPLQSFHRRLPA